MVFGSLSSRSRGGLETRIAHHMSESPLSPTDFQQAPQNPTRFGLIYVLTENRIMLMLSME